MMKDVKAEELVDQMSENGSFCDNFERIKQIPISEFLKVMRIMLTRQMDRYTQDFLNRHLDAVVVHIGCGLDTRYQRMGDNQGEWFDMDFPNVIELWQNLIGDLGTQQYCLPCSVLDNTWIDAVSVTDRRPFLFLAEGVFMYFKPAQVKSLVLTLHKCFPGAELIFDAFSPFLRWSHNLKVTRVRVGSYLNWDLKHGKTWNNGELTKESVLVFAYSRKDSLFKVLNHVFAVRYL